MSMPPRFEVNVEETFCKKIKRWAMEENIHVETIKLNLAGRRGWPDRLVLWGQRNTIFIEFKRIGEEPRKLQRFVHALLQEMGFEVRVYDTAAEALEDVKAKIRATTTTTPSNGPWRDAGGVPPVSETGEGEDSSSFEDIRHPLSGG